MSASAKKRKVKKQAADHYLVVCKKCKIRLIYGKKSPYTKECGLCGSKEVTVTAWLRETNSKNADSNTGLPSSSLPC